MRAIFAVLILGVMGCAGSATSQKNPIAENRVTKRSIGATCPGELEIVLPFYEGIDLLPADAAMDQAKISLLDLAYPGQLSMPMVAWRCGENAWSALVSMHTKDLPVEIQLKRTVHGIDASLRCLSECDVREIVATGSWQDIAAEVRKVWRWRFESPPLTSRYDHFDFFVRHWVASDGVPLREDWTRDALHAHLHDAMPRTLSFFYGLDPSEVDREGKYFWNAGAREEFTDLVRVNHDVAAFHWLNLRTYKFAIPRLGITRAVPPEVHAAAKMHANGTNEISQYAFTSLEMCTASAAWQASREAEMRELVDVGAKVIALDEFPIAPRWGTEACRATNHLHHANDPADEWRITMELVQRLAAYARAHDVLLTSEEPSVALFPYVSGYVDGAFNSPADAYEVWEHVRAAKKIPLFSMMYGDHVTPYTRPGDVHDVPSTWLVETKVTPQGR